MRKCFATLVVTLTSSHVACVQDTTPVGQAMNVRLVAAKTIPMGTVTVSNSTDGLFVTVKADAGWELREGQLAVATSLAGIPQTKSGNPKPGKFTFKRKCGAPASELSYTIPLSVAPGTELFLALHADVRRTGTGGGDEDDDDGDDDDGDEGEESAWAQGEGFPGKNWAMYFRYTVQDARPPSLAGMYRTHTQDAWGGMTEAGSYMAAHFGTAFRGGLTIGSADGFSALFTSDRAVSLFLPQRGVPAALTQSWVDPRDLANPLAGSALALSLNVGFDAGDADFSAGVMPLEVLVVADPSSRFFGLSVRDVLGLANAVLAGGGDAVGVVPDEIHDCVTRINENFENGVQDLGFLSLP